MTSAANGSTLHASRLPTGTTSEWPAKQKCLPERRPESLAWRLSTRAVPGASKGIRRHANSAGASAFASVSSAPASAGVTLGHRISACAWATGSMVFGALARDDCMTVRPTLVLGVEPEIPQQVVDRGLGARLFVHALHDHRAIEAGARLVVGECLAGHCAG